MNSQLDPRSDRKLLLAVSGVVVAGAVGVALVAALTAREESEPAAQSSDVVQAAVSPAVPEAVAVAQLEPASSAEARVVLDPDADPWQAGLRAYGERDYATAAAYLTVDAERRPESPETHYLLGLALWKSGRLDAALEAMQRSAELDESLDTGPVLTTQAVDIRRDETAGELTDRLASTGGDLLARVLPSYLEGGLRPVPQVDDGATYAAKLSPDDRPIRPEMSALEAINRIRGLSPSPGATLDLDGEPLFAGHR